MELSHAVIGVFTIGKVGVGEKKINVFDGVLLCGREIMGDFAIITIGIFDPGNQLLHGMLGDFLIQGLYTLMVLSL